MVLRFYIVIPAKARIQANYQLDSRSSGNDEI